MMVRYSSFFAGFQGVPSFDLTTLTTTFDIIKVILAICLIFSTLHNQTKEHFVMSKIENLIYETIDEINLQTPSNQRLEKSPATIIVGEGSSLDSLGIVNFFVSLEEKVTSSTGQSISLLRDDVFVNQDSPLKTVAQIEHYILKLI